MPVLIFCFHYRKKDEELNTLGSLMGNKSANKNALKMKNNDIKLELERIDRRSAELNMRIKTIKMKVTDLENAYDEPKDINCLVCM